MHSLWAVTINICMTYSIYLQYNIKYIQFQFRCCHHDVMHSVNMLGNQYENSPSFWLSTQHKPSITIWLMALTALVSSQFSCSLRDERLTQGLLDDDSSLSTAVWSILSSPGTDCTMYWPLPTGIIQKPLPNIFSFLAAHNRSSTVISWCCLLRPLAFIWQTVVN